MSRSLATYIALPGTTAEAMEHWHEVFGGQLETVAAAGGACPIYTIRAGSVTPVPQAASGTVAPMQLPAATAKDAAVVNFTKAADADRPALSQAKAIVAGGRGVGSEESFGAVVEPLADALSGAVGVTRDVADEGWYDAKYQIGQTGDEKQVETSKRRGQTRRAIGASTHRKGDCRKTQRHVANQAQPF